MDYDTPVLLIIFNRPDITRQTLTAIRKVQPKYLFVAADGPRHGHPDDLERCRAAREVINDVDWDCELKTLFRDQNRGCGYGPAEAITWFFEHVEHGIILEDDCMPSESFFPYCAELLERYKNDGSIYMITGTNPLKRWRRREASYHYAFMGNSLGWASWRRAWQSFDYTISQWGHPDGQSKLRQKVGSRYFSHFNGQLDEIYRNQPKDIWDFQWLYARWVHGGRTIVPSKNLVTNIGFNEQATHSLNENDLLANLPVFELVPPYVPPARKHDHLFDRMVFERFINPQPRSFFKKAVMKAAKIITGTN